MSSSKIQKACEHIKSGGVVAFPTETVYGLGANAFNKDAIEKIYKIKNRPSNNPLILHIANTKGAYSYWNLNTNERTIIEKLSKFWPGPLTILAKRNKRIPIICDRENIGIRVPNNKVARDLIYNSGVPLFAPSANLSGKVSSTTYEHVVDYFGKNPDVVILKSDEMIKVGIERTIVKVENDMVTVLRPGFITKKEIEIVLGIDNVTYKNKYIQGECPGSSIKHYSISKNTLLFNLFNPSSFPELKLTDEILDRTIKYFNQSILVDFNGKQKNLQDYFYGYVDLSENGDIKEALFNFYNVMHQLEKIKEVKNVLIYDYYKTGEDYHKTLYDRAYRCCSGKTLMVPYPV